MNLGFSLPKCKLEGEGAREGCQAHRHSCCWVSGKAAGEDMEKMPLPVLNPHRRLQFLTQDAVQGELSLGTMSQCHQRTSGETSPFQIREREKT